MHVARMETRMHAESCLKRMARIGCALAWAATATTGLAGTSGDFVYEINPNFTVKISEYTGPGGNVVIPDTIEGKTVNSIGRYAFSGDTNLFNITIPGSVLYIEEHAFDYCTGLRHVAIPGSVTSLGYRVFSSCTRLTNITVAVTNPAFSSPDGVLYNKGMTELRYCPEGKPGSYTVPNGVTSITAYAFLFCERLTRVTLPATAATIGEGAFWGCTGLTGVTLPNGVVRIGETAFFECSSLPGITIPNSTTLIGSKAFLRCSGLAAFTVGAGNPAYSSRGGVLFNKAQTTLVKYPEGKPGSYAIPATVTRIGDGAFQWCTRLTGVTIPTHVAGIGSSAFAYCSRLAAITIPDSVAEIGHDAFSACTGLASVRLPARLARIRYWTFSGCTRLASITIPGRVTEIEGQAFAGCTRLARITIPHGVTRIGMSAFWGCTGLTRVILGRGVNAIDDWAFQKCSRLAEVYFRGDAPRLGADVFKDTPRAPLYRVQGTTGWTSPFGGRTVQTVDAYEPDNIQSAARRIANGQTQRRSIHAAGNTDWAKLAVGGRGARNLRLETAGAAGDTQLWLYRANGTLAAYDDNSGTGRFSRIPVATLPAGTYYVRIREYGNNARIPAYTLRATWTPR